MLTITNFFQKYFDIFKNGQKKMSKNENRKKVLEKIIIFFFNQEKIHENYDF